MKFAGWITGLSWIAGALGLALAWSGVALAGDGARWGEPEQGATPDAEADEGATAPDAEKATPEGSGDAPEEESAPDVGGNEPPADEAVSDGQGQPVVEEVAPAEEEIVAPEEEVAEPEEIVAPVEPVVEPEPVQPAEVVVPEAKPLAPRPRHRWIYSNLSAFRYNPLGLVNEFTTGYRYQLIDKDSVLFRESFIAAQLHTYVSPAYSRIGPKIDFQPLALLNLSATYDFTGYFSTFGLFQSFTSPTEDWSDTELDRRKESGNPNESNYSTIGHHVTLAALLQAKVKNIAVRDNLKFYWANFDLREGDTTYYHQTLDILQPNRGWSLTNDADLLYLLDFGLTLGVRYTLTHAFYQEEHFQPTEPLSRPNGPTHRVGPAVLYTFFDRPGQRFNKPTLILLMQWWTKHRFRTGQDTNAAIPYVVLGFRFVGDLLPDPATWNKKEEPKRKRRGRSKR